MGVASLPPEWEVSIPTFSLGILGSYIADRWTVQLNRLGLVGARVEKLMEGMVSQVLQELPATLVYSTRYTVMQHKKAQDECLVYVCWIQQWKLLLGHILSTTC